MNSDQKVGLVLLIFCLTMWFFIVPTQIKGVRESVYPKFIIIWIGVGSFLLVLQGWKKDASKRILYRLQKQNKKNKKGIVRVIVIAILFSIYIFMIDFLGFFISSFLFLVITMLIIGVRDWRKLILMPAIMLLLVFLMGKLLIFLLPKGKIF